MKWSVVGLGLGLALGLASAAQAKTASIDFTGDQPVAMGLTLVNNSAGSDGVVQIIKKGGKNVAATGGTDAARYLYLKLDDAFKQGLKSAWVTVEYFDEGKGGFKLQFDGADDAYTTAGSPPTGLNFDTQQFTHQTWHIVGFKLKGGETGGADMRIDDRAADDADGQQFISKVTVSDEDPDFSHFPYAVNKITIDGKVSAGEWDGAYQVKLDKAQYDAIRGAPNWNGPDEFNGTYSFKYDENNFYVLGQVHDTTPRLNSTDDGLNYWNGDAMELFLGLDETDVERTAYGEKDFQIMVGFGKTPGWGLYPAGTSLDPIGTNLGIVDASDGYTFELQVPWKVLNNNTVTPGQRIGWYMFADNSKEDPSSQSVALGPTGRTGPSNNPSGWIRGMLDPKPAE
jgi:Carbohydrate family 9 binding domain-like